jgi:serine/threonine protein kinase
MPALPSPAFDEQLAIGSVLDGRYRIDAVLGTGGMGRVYRAEHTGIGKTVAIKVLHADLHRNREASQRFQREAIASGRLDHPNIVGVSDSGVLDDGACYLVMEALEGESLGDRLARDRRIPWGEAIEILRGVLYGLGHAHERGVVHRDIKPDNVYLARKDGKLVVKILDFGIAKLIQDTADDPAATRAGLTVGTPAYLSPEQAVGGEISPASDLYSASIVLYEMLAGRAPFEDKDPIAMLGAHVGRRPPAFADTAPGVDIPPPLEEIVQRGLMKSAAERIGAAGDYLMMLDAFSPPPTPPPRRITGSMAPAGEWVGGTTPVRLTTPIPGMTPVRPTTRISGVTPLPTPTELLPAASATPMPLERAQLPRAMRTVSLSEVSEPIPLTWIVRSGVVVGLVIIGAIVLAITKHCSGDAPTSSTKSPAMQPASPKSRTKAPGGQPTSPSPNTKPAAISPASPSPKSSAASPAPSSTKPPAALSASLSPKPLAVSPAPPGTKPAAVSPAPAPPGTKPPVVSPASPSPKPVVARPASPPPSTKPADREAQLKQLVHDLESGKTCADRKASISKLVELHDARAVQPLMRARARTGGKGDDGNACLKADAERAIKELGGTLK